MQGEVKVRSLNACNYQNQYQLTSRCVGESPLRLHPSCCSWRFVIEFTNANAPALEQARLLSTEASLFVPLPRGSTS